MNLRKQTELNLNDCVLRIYKKQH